jgi:hypothetical protein
MRASGAGVQAATGRVAAHALPQHVPSPDTQRIDPQGGAGSHTPLIVHSVPGRQSGPVAPPQCVPVPLSVAVPVGTQWPVA